MKTKHDPSNCAQPSHDPDFGVLAQLKPNAEPVVIAALQQWQRPGKRQAPESVELSRARG
jgi:hypothetical protein